jgi:hypothetical protein
MAASKYWTFYGRPLFTGEHSAMGPQQLRKGPALVGVG